MGSNSHLTTDTDRLVEGVAELLLAKRVDGLAKDLVSDTGVVAQASNRVGDVGVTSDTDTLARVEAGAMSAAAGMPRAGGWPYRTSLTTRGRQSSQRHAQ